MLELREELGPLGPRADHAHASQEHVPELRQLVEVRLAKPAADRRDAAVAGLRPAGPGDALGVLAHRADLVDDERHAAPAETHLRIDGRPAQRESSPAAIAISISGNVRTRRVRAIEKSRSRLPIT